jgi:hypothetical protein
MTFNPEIVESQLLQLVDYLEFLKTFEKRSLSEFIQVRHFKGTVKGYASTVKELEKQSALSEDLGK